MSYICLHIMVNKQVFSLLLLILAGCNNIAQPSRSNIVGDSGNTAVTGTSANPPDPSPANIRAAKFAAPFAALLTPCICIAALAYTQELTSLPTLITAAMSMGSWLFYGCISVYTRKANIEEIKHFKQKMLQAQPLKENTQCPICLEYCNDNKPLYSLPGCPGHCFHPDCIEGYIKKTPLYNLKCPMCRKAIDMTIANQMHCVDTTNPLCNICKIV